MSLPSDLFTFDLSEIKVIRSTWSNNLAKIDDNQDIKNSVQTVKPSSSMFSSFHFWTEVYNLLLDRHPELVDVLPSIKHQTVSFSGIMYTAIMNLENLSAMNNFLENLGRRHARVFGAEPVYFEYMGQAFLDTLANKFGDFFTPEIESAWIKLYSFLSNSIIQSGQKDPVMKNGATEFRELERFESGTTNSFNSKLNLTSTTISAESLNSEKTAVNDANYITTTKTNHQQHLHQHQGAVPRKKSYSVINDDELETTSTSSETLSSVTEVAHEDNPIHSAPLSKKISFFRSRFAKRA